MIQLERFFSKNEKEDYVKFYEDYLARIHRVKEIEAQQVASNETLLDWCARYHRKSDEIRLLYQENQKQLEYYIYPLLDGRVPMNSYRAEILTEIIYKNRSKCSDSLVSLDVLRVIIDYYDVHPPKKPDSHILALASAAYYAELLNTEELIEDSLEFASKAITMAGPFPKIKNEYVQERVFYLYINRVLIAKYRKNVDIKEVMQYLYEAEEFYLSPENRKVGKFDYDYYDEYTKGLAYQTALSPIHAKETDPELVKKYSEECLEYVENKLRSNLDYLYEWPLMRDAYFMAQYHLKQYSPKDVFLKLFQDYQAYLNKLDYDNLPMDSRELFFRNSEVVPDMIALLEDVKEDYNLVQGYREELANTVFKIYNKIPFEKRDADSNFCIWNLFKRIMPYMGIDVDCLNTIMRSTLSTNNTTAVHTQMVGYLAAEIVKSLIQDRPELFIGDIDKTVQEVLFHVKDNIDFARKMALCHDLGKIAVANVISIQYRNLTDNERKAIENYPILGADLTSSVPQISIYSDVVKGHQKSYDGNSGYPKEYKNRDSKLAFWTDLIHICDCLDASTDNYGRVYKKAITFEECLQELIAGKGTEYNPDIVEELENNKMLQKTLKYLVNEGRDAMLYNIYRMGKA